jgi:hypothetical protein
MIGLGIANSLGVNLSGINPAAKSFVSATGISGPNEVKAINDLVNGLQADGIWSKMKAVYPFVTDNRNLLGYTEDFGNAYWTKQSATVSTNTTTAPNETLTADTSAFSSTVQSFVRASSISINSGQTYTISVYVKKSASSGANNIRITTNDTIAWNTGISQKFALTNSWQRITLTGVLTSSVNVCHIVFGSTGIDGNVDATCGGNVDMWGAQLELGSTATTYQPISTTQQAYIANQFKYNLVNPLDTDAAFRLVFNGGWTHSSLGATPNGTNGYADTKLTQTAAGMFSNSHFSFYSRTNSTTAIAQVEMGVGLTTGTTYSNLLMRLDTATSYVGGTVGSRNALSTSANSTGHVIVNGLSASAKAFKNGTLIATDTATQTGVLNTLPIYIGCQNANTIATNFSSRQAAFTSIGDGLTDTEAANLYTRVQTFNQALGRQVGVPIVSDADAQAFLNSAEITDLTQANAINTLVTDLKAQGLWTKMKAVYPFVGGTASTHKWNLKDPRDLDAAYRLVFNGGWTHSSTGATPNGTNGFADTKLNDLSVMSDSSNSLGFYSRTNNSLLNCNDIGAYDGLYFTGLRFNNNNTTSFAHNGTDGASGSAVLFNSTLSSAAFLTQSRTSLTSLKFIRNGVVLASTTNTKTGINANQTFYVGATNGLFGAQQYGNRELALAYFSNGLTDTEAAALNSAVQTYQTTLNRNV